MNKLALIVYDSDFYHRRLAVKLKNYLTSIRVTVETCPVKDGALSRLSQTASRCGEGTVFLLVYIGHGEKMGWKNIVSYADIAQVLKNIGPLVVINETCYGLRLLSLLRKTRETRNTLFISPFGSRGETYARAVEDVLRAWPYARTLESFCGGIIQLRSFGNSKVYPPQVRWGAAYEPHFFGDKQRPDLVQGCATTLPPGGFLK